MEGVEVCRCRVSRCDDMGDPETTEESDEAFFECRPQQFVAGVCKGNCGCEELLDGFVGLYTGGDVAR